MWSLSISIPWFQMSKNNQSYEAEERNIDRVLIVGSDEFNSV